MPKRTSPDTSTAAPGAPVPDRGGVYQLDPAANTLTQLEGLPDPAAAAPPAPTAQPEGTSDEN